jgi:hypothetical protein
MPNYDLGKTISRSIRNSDANYYSFVGSYDGAVKIGGQWVRAVELNRIDKSHWRRWTGPPSRAILRAVKFGQPTQATELFPELVKFKKPELSVEGV